MTRGLETEAGARLYHFSEEPGIEVFIPRSPLARPDVEALVWAVDAWHAPHYLLPRDCPRACFWAGPASTADDMSRFLGGASRVVAIERGWLQRVESATVYRYEFEPPSFELIDETAGYFVSRETLRPLSVTPIHDLPLTIRQAAVELRTVDNLYALQLEVAASTLEFSGMRLRNALDYVEPP